jgi:hypothetical protein
MTICTTPGQRSAALELQVVSDATGMPVQQGAGAVSAVYRTGCAGNGFQESETLYLERVSEG